MFVDRVQRMNLIRHLSPLQTLPTVGTTGDRKLYQLVVLVYHLLLPPFCHLTKTDDREKERSLFTLVKKPPEHNEKHPSCIRHSSGRKKKKELHNRVEQTLTSRSRSWSLGSSYPRAFQSFNKRWRWCGCTSVSSFSKQRVYHRSYRLCIDHTRYQIPPPDFLTIRFSHHSVSPVRYPIEIKGVSSSFLSFVMLSLGDSNKVRLIVVDLVLASHINV